MVDPILAKTLDICWNCVDASHLGAKCSGSWSPGPDGDTFGPCPCDDNLDYETAGQKIVELYLGD